MQWINARARACLVALVGLTFFAGPAMAEYPNKPVSIVIPFPPGDLEDVVSRMIAEDFQKTYGVPAAVVNKPGGGGGPFPGAVSVAKAPADGYTIGSFVVGVPVVGPLIGIPELNPDPFEPLGIFLTYPFVLASSKDGPIKDIDSLVATAKQKELALGHFGAPLVPTKVSLAMAKKLGFEWGSDAAFDALDCNTLASGDADVINTTVQLILPCLDKVNVIASVTSRRISLVPDAPTVAEIEPTLNIALWNGLFVRKDTPADVRAKIVAVASKTVISERAQALAKKTGAQIYWLDAGKSAAQIQSDIKVFKAIGALLN